MNIFEKGHKQKNKAETNNTVSAANKSFTIKSNGMKFKVNAESEKEAENKVNILLGIEKQEKKEVSINNIIKDVMDEIERIVKTAHPEFKTNTPDKWIVILTEELGELTRAINKEQNGKVTDKDVYTECIQLIAATILMTGEYLKHK